MANQHGQSTHQLAGISLETLQDLLRQWQQPAFRARQILDWRDKGILNPEHMGNLPRNLRRRLGSEIECESLQLIRRQCSADGTRKYVFSLKRPPLQGRKIESVLIPEAKRATVCISSQIGCVLDCPFCYTGTQGFEGNLTAAEIIAQILAIKHDLHSDPLPQTLHNEVTHIVYMGMGEPLANEAGVHGSLRLLLDDFRISRRRITLSTSGLVPQIERLGENYPVNLAISLHAADNDLRDRLVPINRKYPLERLRECLDGYPLGRQRHITLEYVMLAGVNDREEDICSLLAFVNPARERLNLIQFNPYPGNPFLGSSKEHMNAFAQRLISKGIRATVRRSRGEDIMAACGQLKAETSATQTAEH